MFILQQNNTGMTKLQDVTKQVSCKILWRKLRLRGSLLLVLIQFLGGVRGKGVGWGGRLFEAGRLLTFSAFRIGAYSRWALIRGWALNRINTVLESNFYQSFSLLIDRKTEECSQKEQWCVFDPTKELLYFLTDWVSRVMEHKAQLSQTNKLYRTSKSFLSNRLLRYFSASFVPGITCKTWSL